MSERSPQSLPQVSQISSSLSFVNSQAIEMFSSILSEKKKIYIPEALFWLSVVAVVFIDSFHDCELVSLIKVHGRRLEIKLPSIIAS